MRAFVKSAALAGGLALAAGAASAATITGSGDIAVGDNGAVINALEGGTSVTFTFTATDGAVRILDELSATVNGFNSGVDVMASTSGIDGSLISFEDVDINGATGTGTSNFGGFVLAQGESFDFTFSNGGDGLVLTSLTFAVAAVPVPAAGVMLLTALLGAGAVARRKAKTA